MAQRHGVMELIEATRGTHWYAPVGLMLLLVPLSFANYLAFHLLAELFAIIIAVNTFVVAWNTYPFSRNDYLVYLGLGYFWIAAVDLVHTMVYRGMGIVPELSANPATQLWLVARYGEALLLLSAPLFLRHRLVPGRAFTGFAVLFVLLMGAVWTGHFPEAFVEGRGLTAFKVVSEYIIIVLLALAGLHLWRRRELVDQRILGLVLVAITLTMLAEFSFTLYVSVYGLSNLVGHFLKLASFWLIYVALVESALRQPFRTMARGASSFDAVPEPTVVVASDGTIHQLNDAARRFLGADGREAIGRHCHGYFHPPELDPSVCPVCTAIAAGRAVREREFELAGKGLWLEISTSAIERAREFSGAVHVSRDITERKRASQELARMNRELGEALRQLKESQMQIIQSEKMSALGILTAGIAHELNNPLMGIHNYLDYALNKCEGRPREVLGKAARELARTQQILHNMLTFARPTEVGLAAVSVTEVVERTLQLLAADLRAGQIEVRRELGPDLPMVRARTDALQQVVLNLVLNAKDAMAQSATRVLTVSADSDAERVYLRIGDTGSGMSEAVKARIFEPFFTTKPSGKGTGLGLPVSKRIVEEFGGTMECETALRVGTRFVLSLPRW